ncbi:MAG: 2-C-methyl-D-erythritol 4-phosphate cytidylyltransferase [Phycisphaeraceae bacterium]
MKIAVILPAAGVGKRFAQSDANSAATSKIEQDLGGRPVFLRAIELFLNRPNVGQIIIAVNPDAVDEFRFRWSDKLAFHGVTIVAGGRKERWETVLKALEAVQSGSTHAAIHDAARPLTSAALIDRVFEAAAKYPAVIPGLPASATLKRVAPVDSPPQDADPLDAIFGSAGKPTIHVQRVVATVDRRDMVEVQTPQVFALDLLRRAYAQITDGRLDPTGVTDDASLIEAMGEPVMVVEGESTNLKITRPPDLALASAFVAAQEQKHAIGLAKKRLFADEEE